MDAGEEPPCASPAPFRAASASIFRDISNFKTPKPGPRKPSFYRTPGTQFLTTSKQKPWTSTSSMSLSVRRRTSLAPSSTRAGKTAARRLRALEIEQSQSSRKALVQKEQSLKSLAKSLTVWLNFLFENPGYCGCKLSTDGQIGRQNEAETSATGKREALPGVRVRVDMAWRNPKRQRDSEWRAGDGEDAAGFLSSAYSSLQNSMKDVCSLEDLKGRMRVYLSLGACKEVFHVMTLVSKNIDEGRLKMKAHCPLVTDVGLRQKATKILMCFNPIWLRIGLYVVFGGDSLLSCGDSDSDQEISFLRMIIEKQFFSHSGLAKEYAYNKKVEGLYRPGYYEALGNIILKRLLLLVLVLDRAKSQSSLSINYGIDGVDGGSPLLFTVQSVIKSSCQLIHDFLSSDVMLGEGNVLAHLMIVGYKLSYQQCPLVEYDFQLSDLFVDLQDGVRLGRATHLLLDDSSILAKLIVPSDTSKKQVANCGVVLQYVRKAGVSLCDDDEMMIVGDDIVNGDKELTLSLLWNMFVHLQLPHLMKQTSLVEEIYKIRGDSADDINPSKLTHLELLLRWIQAICQKYNFRIDNFSSVGDGKAIWCLLDYYFRKEHPCSCSTKDSCRPTGEESIVLVTDYPDAVHDFLLSQRLTTLLGNFPEVLQISDILEYNGTCNDKSVVILLVFLASQLIVKKNMDQLNFHKLLGCHYQSPVRKLCFPSSEELGKDVTCGRTTEVSEEDAARKFKAVQAWWQEMAESSYQRDKQPTAPNFQEASTKQNTINFQRETAAKVIQSHCRRVIERQNYVKTTKAASLLQTFIRSWLTARKPSKTNSSDYDESSFDLTSASIVIQKIFRMCLARSRYNHDAVQLEKAKKGLLDEYFNAVIVIQKYFRGWLVRSRYSHQVIHMFAKTGFCEQKHASIVIQKHFRGWLVRSRYSHQVLQSKNAISIFPKTGFSGQSHASIVIQKYFRGWFVRSRNIHEAVVCSREVNSVHPKMGFSDQINSSVIIQKHFRGLSARSRYTIEIARREKAFELAASIVIQKYYRGWVSRSRYANKVSELTNAAVKIQCAWKSYIIRNRLRNLHFSTIRIQSRFRCWILRIKFQNQKQAALRIQSNFRMSRCSKTYQRHKSLIQSAIVVQSSVRQWISQREAYRRNHMITVIQRHFRGCLARKEYSSQREAATKILSAIQRHRYRTESVLVIQSHIRRWIVRRRVAREYCSVLKLQRWWRGVLTLKLRTRSVLVIQSHIRGWIVRKNVIREYCSVLKLQKWWRGILSLKLRTRSTLVIQSHIRGWVARRNFTREYCSALKLQRWWRCIVSLKLRTRPVLVIQSLIRGWIARRQATTKRRQIVLIQSCWKGYLARKASKGQLRDLRLRMETTAANVDDGMRIINRLIAAVSELLSKKSLSGVLHICATLDMTTQYSVKCCEELVKAKAIDTLLELIRSVTRSIPDQEVLKHTLSTLQNIARYPHLVEVLIDCRGSVETILLQMLRSKEEAFFIASNLMTKICLSPKGVEAVRTKPALLKRLHNLIEELSRKALMEKRNVRGPVSRENTERRLREAVHLLKMVT